MTVLVAMVAAPAVAQSTHIRPQLLAESMTPAPGQRVAVAIDMRTAKGWHGYWSNPGEAGFAPRLKWTLPRGVTLSPPRFPVPQTLTVAGLMNYVFERDHALLFTLDVPQGLARGTALPVRLDAEWLACTDEVCVPEKGSFTLALTVGDGKRDAQARFDGFRRALAVPLGAQATLARDADRLRIAIPYPADAKLGTPHFFPAAPGTIMDAAPQTFSRNGDVLIASLAAPPGALGPVQGVLALGDGRGLEIAAEPGTVPPDGTPLGKAAAASISAILLAIGGALLGGLILNVMPCVFPIVSLKALSLARAGGDERAAKREAVAYAGGVILTCLALGGIILGARAAGTQLGWAFQLQNPWIVLILLVIATVITLNLAGLFELRAFGGGSALAGKGGAQGAFWTGVLAAFVATPCTGPFMAAALGAALVLPVAAAMAVFAGLGLGLALPFLAIGFVPALRRMLPRPGAWMVTFQRVLAIPMALTVIALLWLIDRSQGALAFQSAVIGVILIGVAAVSIGRRQTGVIAALAAMLIAGVVAIKADVLTGAQAAERPVMVFSEAALTKARAENRPVFVYFTADWCLTCKVNEKTAIGTAQVTAAFDRNRVAVMAGDWTDGDPAITRFLNAQGAFGVPLYLYYAPGAAEPQVLPQILTPAALIALSSS
ncbi:MAG: protein-disulfide reductase DsbD family protein [Sphingomonadaceae bacterium]